MSAELPAGRPSHRPNAGPFLPVLATAVVAAAGCLLAIACTPADGRVLVASYGGATGVALCVAVALAVSAFATARQVRRRLELVETETARLADRTLPAVVERLREGGSADSALAAVEPPQVAAHRQVLRILAEEVSRRERTRAAAMAACASAAGRVQALATSMLADLREMENRHSEEVLGDLLKLDHTTAQAGRLADSIAVLTGARTGRRWTKPIVMESILRGAVGRISAYQRVRFHSVSTAAIAGYAAEGVMHALAELMDNATSFSPPSEQVHVYTEEVQAGVVVTIEDCGLVMSDRVLRNAERAVSATEPLDLTTLSGTRLGLAVVGCLARRYGLTVSFRPSSRGGTGVVVLIPRELISQGRRTTDPIPAAPHPAPDPPPPPAPAADAPPAPVPATAPTDRDGPGETAPAGDQGPLPRRRRGQTLAAAVATTAGRAAPAAPRPPADAGARFTAFRQAVTGASGNGAEAAHNTP